MKAILFLIIIILAFSCQTNHYAGNAIKGSNVYTTLIKKDTIRILIAETNNRIIDPTFQESCMKGLRFNIELHTNIKIADNIVLNANPSTTILKELKTKYQVNGLLLLIKLKTQKQAYDVESKKVYLIPERHDIVKHPAYWGTVPWTNLYVQITSKWIYFDLDSGRHHDFEVKNKKVVEFGKYVSDEERLLDGNIDMLDALFYQNGKMTAEKF
jgi:hypothetical protein